MSKETKLGLLAAIVIAFTIWGLKFLKGENILKNNRTFYVEYTDVTSLKVSSPVLFNGLEIGTVKDIFPHETNSQLVVVELIIDKPLKIPKNANVVQFSTGMMGARAMRIDYDAPCSGPDCVEDGEYLKGEIVGLLGSMISEEDVDNYMGRVGSGLTNVFDTLSAKMGGKNMEDGINKSMQDIQIILSNLVSTTSKLNRVMSENADDLSAVMNNLNSITTNFTQSNHKINNMLSNFEKVSKELSESGIGSTVKKTKGTMDDANGAIQELQTTLEKANVTFDKLSGVMTSMENGEGSLGKLIKDEDLYNNLEETTHQLNLLLQDFRLNPKRYVNVSVFGKKQKKYVVPEDDPAEQE